MGPDLSIEVAGLHLKNPVMAGSGEATMDLASLEAALDAGAAAVVAKSTNESAAAGRQLERAEYVLLDEEWRPVPWGPAPRGASLFCRSGLPDVPFERWVEMLAAADGYAAPRDAFVVASLIVSDSEEAARRAKELEAAGLRWLEVNVGAPHAEEAPPGAIRSTTTPETVEDLVRPIREAVSVPITVKLSGEGRPLGVAAAALDAGADALCLAGRHLGFLPDLGTRRPVLGTFGAIGGSWALPLTLRWIAKARARFGPGVPLIGTNGARSGPDVARFLLAGARAVQMTSLLMTDGPAALARTIADLGSYLAGAGLSAADIVGEAADSVARYESATGKGRP